MSERPLAILLNGPLGIGKSTLGEALGESLPRSATIDGDALVAVNPPPSDEASDLNETIALLIAHRLKQGYYLFVINHYWSDRTQIEQLQNTLRAIAPDFRFRIFRLMLSKEQNIRRIEIRRASRAFDEAEHEDVHFSEEFGRLSRAKGSDLGEPFDASDAPDVLVERLIDLLGLPGATQHKV